MNTLSHGFNICCIIKSVRRYRCSAGCADSTLPYSQLLSRVCQAEISWRSTFSFFVTPMCFTWFPLQLLTKIAVLFSLPSPMHPTIAQSSNNFQSCHDPELNLKWRGCTAWTRKLTIHLPRASPSYTLRCIRHTALEEDELLPVSEVVIPKSRKPCHPTTSLWASPQAGRDG